MALRPAEGMEFATANSIAQTGKASLARLGRGAPYWTLSNPASYSMTAKRRVASEAPALIRQM